MASFSSQGSALPDDPSERRKLAYSLVARYEQLNDKERDLVVELAKYSFDPLADRFAKWIVVGGMGWWPNREYEDIFRDVGDRLAKMATKANSHKVMEVAYRVGVTRWWGELYVLPLVLKYVEPAEYAPVFLKLVLASRADPDATKRELALIAPTSDPGTIDMLLGALQDPSAPAVWRRAAFAHLAGAGGERGIAAVLQARAKRAPREPWFVRLKPLANRQLTTKKDSAGNEWGLFRSAILGHWTEVYARRKSKGEWGPPIFLNTTFNDRQSLNWIEIAQAPETLRDSDGDGLTDLVEARLGTSPTNADIDADGYDDAVDPCPNAAPRPLGDREKIIAASVEAYSFGNRWPWPSYISVSGVNPFEFYGFAQPLIWGESKNSNHFEFLPPKEGEDWLQIAPDGKTARTKIIWRLGPQLGNIEMVDLVKFGEDWLVTNLTPDGPQNLLITRGG